MRSQVVLAGRFEVTDTGEVYRIKKGNREKATVYSAGRNRNYEIVSYYENGKQNHAYVHRLVASAFIPNPGKLPEVNHKNGDTHDNRAENLEWVTRKENANHAVSIGLSNVMATGAPCAMCGNFTKSKRGICPACWNKSKSDAKRMDHMQEIRKELSTIDLGGLTEKTRNYVICRMKGMTYQDIADVYRVTRQCVEQAISAALRKSKNAQALTRMASSMTKDDLIRALCGLKIRNREGEAS